MSFDLGDILHIDAPIAGYMKYHICLGQNEYFITICLYLNTDAGFAGCVAFDCDKFPMLPPSKTGQTVVSLALLPRYSERQLQLFKAKKLGELPKDVVPDIVALSAVAKTLTAPERAFVTERLRAYAGI